MKSISPIIDIAIRFLPKEDAEIVKEFYENNEFGLAVMQTVDRLYDLDIKIDANTINKISDICKYLEIDPDEWKFIFDLASDEKSHTSNIELDSLGGDALYAYDDIISEEMSPEECLRALQESGVSELIVTRILRQKYGMNFDDAIAQISLAKPH